MVFSQEWETSYRANTHLSIWPWSDLVSFVMRYARPTGPAYKVLELGCGAGANIPFFKNLKVDYYGIEGSASIVDRLRKQFPEIKDKLIVADFTKELPVPGNFDLIVDRGSITHNSTAAIRECLKQIKAKMKPDGTFIGIDWFSTLDHEYKSGEPAEDECTRTNYAKGRLAHVGRVHYSDKAHILDLFADYNIEILEHKVITRTTREGEITMAFWNFVAKNKK